MLMGFPILCILLPLCNDTFARYNVLIHENLMLSGNCNKWEKNYE
jgi:hypothetical protein